ncbi:hypothetical protein F2P79_016895, partial [Pimephales promelas]
LIQVLMQKKDCINGGWLQGCPPLLDGPASSTEVALTAAAAGWNSKDGAGKDTKLRVVELMIAPPAQNISVILHCMILSRVHLDFVCRICHRYIFPLVVKVNCSFLGRGSFSGGLLGVEWDVTELSPNLLEKFTLGIVKWLQELDKKVKDIWRYGIDPPALCAII